MVTSLKDLLRRAHRAELEPLAELLHIDHAQLGLDELASAADRVLRRRSAHDLVNLLRRGGEGPSYASILAGVARSMGIEPGAALGDEVGLLAIESAVCERFINEVLPALQPGVQSRIRERLALQPLALEERRTALAAVGTALSETVRIGGTVAAFGVARLVASFIPPLMPVAGVATLWWLGRVHRIVVLQGILEVHLLRKSLKERITIGITGSPSSGKDAAMKELFGIEGGEVSPIAGSTSEVEIVQGRGSKALFLVNTPGMGDVLESVTERARQVLGLIDVFIYVVNAQGGVQEREVNDHRALVARGRPVLVVLNKVDTIGEEDRARLLEDTRVKLGVAIADCLPAAFDPILQLSEAPIGLDEVRAWLEHTLEAGGKQASELPWHDHEV